MLLLAAFALLAGAGTALSPCVLPILPAVLSAGVSGGRRRPLGIVVGLTLSFTFAAVALVYVIEALGLPDDIQRIVAIVVLIGFGVALMVPAVGDRIEAWISRVVGVPRMRGGEGFGSGLVLGGALGLAYFPCAGPILAGVITVSASQEFTAGRLAIALCYAAGSGAVLYAMLRFGRRFTDRLRGHERRIQFATGAIMVTVAVLMTANLDVRFQNAIADDLPAFLTNPTGSIERSGAVTSRIGELSSANEGAVREGGIPEEARGGRLPVLGRAPDIVDPGQFFNTSGGAPISISELTRQGKTVLVDFWTYTCINCIRTLPEVESWYERYRRDGLVVIGVHTPEFPFERDAGNVADAIGRNGITYPVVQDNDYGTWDAFGNQYWPAKYLIDSGGRVRYAHFGEGDYEQTEDAIRELLAGGGDAVGERARRVSVDAPDPGLRTPETYLGSARAQGWTRPVTSGSHDFGSPGTEPGPNRFAYSGSWRITGEDATAAADARIDATFTARRVYLVLGSPGEDRRVAVQLDGREIRPSAAGADVDGGEVTVGSQRLYSLVDLPRAGRHTLTLEFAPGVSGYAFTFG
ncbi:MAG: cytochrome c biogenesis protein DipZ [Solirubrobacterales bacterium]|nr:cytochrome c biogenesis protein DipZ [Solirubrobacterales bacterium]